MGLSYRNYGAESQSRPAVGILPTVPRLGAACGNSEEFPVPAVAGDKFRCSACASSPNVVDEAARVGLLFEGDSTLIPGALARMNRRETEDALSPNASGTAHSPASLARQHSLQQSRVELPRRLEVLTWMMTPYTGSSPEFQLTVALTRLTAPVWLRQLFRRDCSNRRRRGNVGLRPFDGFPQTGFAPCAVSRAPSRHATLTFAGRSILPVRPDHKFSQHKAAARGPGRFAALPF